MRLSKEILQNPMYKFLLLLVISITAGFQAWRTLFNNFVVDVVGFDGIEIGMAQSVRELAGFLTFLVVFVIMIIKEHRLGTLSVLVFGLGIILTGFFPSYSGVLVTTFIMSIGFHYFETINQSLSLQYFSHKNAPIVIANLKSTGAAVNIVVGAIVWLISGYVSLNMSFVLFGVLVMLMGGITMFMNPTKKNVVEQNKRFVLKRKYWLYYVLNFLSGARRQIFVVFAVFMLVKKYGFSVQMVSILFVINNVINIFFNPLIAKGINRFGERKMLTIEYSFLTLVFLGYAFIENVYIVGALYVIDHVFFGFGMSINTYFQKTADPKDIAPSVSVAFAINHISAVIIPIVGGLLWMYNWRIPFIAGAVFSVISLGFSQLVKIDKKIV